MSSETYYVYDAVRGWTALPPCEASLHADLNRGPVALGGPPPDEEGARRWEAEGYRKRQDAIRQRMYNALRVGRLVRDSAVPWSPDDFIDISDSPRVGWHVDVSEIEPKVFTMGFAFSRSKRFSMIAHSRNSRDAEAEAIWTAVITVGGQIYTDHEDMANKHNVGYVPRRLNGNAHYAARFLSNFYNGLNHRDLPPESELLSLSPTSLSHYDLRARAREPGRGSRVGG